MVKWSTTKTQKTSNAVKKRYNDKTYTKFTFLVPKAGGLDLYLQDIKNHGGSMGEVIRRALVEFIARGGKKIESDAWAE